VVRKIQKATVTSVKLATPWNVNANVANTVVKFAVSVRPAKRMVVPAPVVTIAKRQKMNAFAAATANLLMIAYATIALSVSAVSARVVTIVMSTVMNAKTVVVEHANVKNVLNAKIMTAKNANIVNEKGAQKTARAARLVAEKSAESV
jgi:hypothetical protein